MSEKLTLNLMSLALAFGIVLTWITWDPKFVIVTMVLSVLRLFTLFYEYPELVGRTECKDSGSNTIWRRIKFWLKRDSRRMQCRGFCVRCPYYEVCKDDRN